MIGFVI